MQNKRGFLYLSTVGAVLALLVTVNVAVADQKAKEKSVAMVNGTYISQANFDWEMNRAVQVYGRGKPVGGSRLEEIKNRALENLIERELLYQESRRKGIIVEASAVDKQLDAMKSKFPSADVFSKEIGKMNLTEETLKEQLERAIATQRFVEKEIVDTIVVPESAVLDYYKKNKSRMMQPEQIRASHVLIKVDPQKGPEQKKDARKTIEQIEAKVKKGEDFSALAKEYSQCPSSDRGGDLGYFGRGQMVKPFEEAAFALKPGEVSGIVETRFGYHVIKMNEKRPASEMSFEDVKEQLERYLKQEKINEAIGKYVAMLKKDAEIERMLPQDLKAKP